MNCERPDHSQSQIAKNFNRPSCVCLNPNQMSFNRQIDCVHDVEAGRINAVHKEGKLEMTVPQQHQAEHYIDGAC